MADRASQSRGLGRYVGSAFRQRWNLGLLAVGAAFAALSPFPDALLPIVAGLEGIFLLGMVSRPRFREYVDARDAALQREAQSNSATDLYAQLQLRLGLADRQRFQGIVDRCQDMHRLASSVHSGDAPSEDMRSAALNKLLFFYLRLLVARRSLQQFLAQSNRAELEAQRSQLNSRLESAQKAKEPDARVVSSLQDTIKDLDIRIANMEKGEKDEEFVELELTRIEGKVHALAEAAITRQDPAELSAQVTAFTDTLRLSQDVASQMISLEDLELATAEAPPILDTAGTQRIR